MLSWAALLPTFSSAAVPVITFPPESSVFMVDQFEAAIFTCAAAGIPLPDISWTRQQNGQNTTLQTSSSITIGDPVTIDDYVLPSVMGVVTGINRSLTLSEARDGDSGTYFCLANSISGNDNIGFQLAVQG